MTYPYFVNLDSLNTDEKTPAKEDSSFGNPNKSNRVEGNVEELKRRLLSSMLTPQKQAHDSELKDSPILESESLFVQALQEMDLGYNDVAVEHFEKAAELFSVSRNFERALLSKFHALAARTRMPTAETLKNLRHIEKESRQIDAKHVLGLVLRQKSFLWFDDGKYHAALHEVEKALLYLELWSPASDWYLGLIHAAQSCWQTGDLRRACGHLEKVPMDVEPVVAFPQALVRALIEGTELPQASDFAVASEYWVSRAKRAGQMRQDRPLPVLPPTGSRGLLKANSLEARLCDLLEHGPLSKVQLCHELWPENVCKMPAIDNRLHRLISRTNKKLGSTIKFDGSQYRILSA